MQAILVAFALFGLLAAPGHAQVPHAGKRQVVSIDPLGLIFSTASAEYERNITGASTLGLAARVSSPDDHTYRSGDLKYRFYLQGAGLEGLSIGAITGVTDIRGETEGRSCYFVGNIRTCPRALVPGSASAVNLGGELAYQRLIGRGNDFALGTGFGIVRYVFLRDELHDARTGHYILRISAGYAF